MNLRESFELILTEYHAACDEELAQHDLASIIKSEIPHAIAHIVRDDKRYKFKASVGNGNWARIPWIAIFDTMVTNSAQTGYYPVYLFKEDMSGFYLSLNQGVTEVKTIYQSNAPDALRSRANQFRDQISTSRDLFTEDQIDLASSSKNIYAVLYEAGNICAKYYALNELPAEEELIADLNSILLLYHILSDNEITSTSAVCAEEDELPYTDIEDLRAFRRHKRYERNRQLAKKVKQKQGVKCQVCEIEFAAVYGEIGKGYIEAHHLTPIAQLKGQKVSLDPVEDFAVLCANCHRMIHFSQYPHDVARFKQEHYLPLKTTNKN